MQDNQVRADDGRCQSGELSLRLLARHQDYQGQDIGQNCTF
jgi:hypothetical protein